MKIGKRQALFIVLMFIISGFIVYLGIRTIKHEVLLRHYQAQNIAQSQLAQVAISINSLLNEKAAHFDAVTNYIQLNDSTINALLEHEIDIKNIFVIQQSKLVYPLLEDIYSVDNERWAQIVMPIVYDSSILYSHYLNSEQASPKSGWFMSYDSNNPVLIYWVKKGEQLIGFQVSYIKFILDTIHFLDEQPLTTTITIFDNDQLIYDNGDYSLIEQQKQISSLRLSYPLPSWQINYYAEDDDMSMLYLFGSGMILLTLLVLCGAVYYGYREYTRTLRLARQQVSFVGQVSHEFKTPLTNITLYTEMLKERLDEEPQPIPHYLDVIASESQRLTRLVQNVLNFTKMPKTHFKTIEINALIKQIYQTFQPVLSAKSMQLNFYPLDRGQELYTDSDRVTQIISNFLNNAEKYAVQGKQVDILIEREGEHYLKITVRDYANGIPNHLLNTIFKPFYRINDSLTEGVSGTGIGLTIAKQLADSLQGSIIVENKMPGIAFSLLLPCFLSSISAK